MKKKPNPLTERISVSVCSLDRAAAKPVYFSIRKGLFIFFALFFIGALCLGAYAGVSAYLSIETLSASVENLGCQLVAQQNALAENARAASLEDGAHASEFDMNNLSPISGDEVAPLDSEDSARMSDPWLEVEATTVSSTISLENGSVCGKVELLDWFNGGTQVFPRFTEAVVIDVETGRSFNIRRISGTYHADSEPLTSGDTAVMKQLYGGRWSWDRRAIWVKIGERYFAASMNGMPHAFSYTGSNGFGGHFCIHFMNSRVHETSSECPVHQSMVTTAFASAHLLDEYLEKNQY